MEQFIFQKDYCEELRKNIKNGNISAYGVDSFDYNKDASFKIGIDRNDNLLETMLNSANPTGDYDAAIALYEAFPNLTREQANYEPFWAYLTHVDLYPYMIERFCDGKTPSLSDIKINWWHKNTMRRGVSNLWWSVKQSIDYTHPTDKYHYTKYFFKRLDFRQRRMGSSTLFRHSEAVLGILKFLEENVTEYFEGRSNFIMMYFNKQATLKQLAAYSRDDFYNELTEILDDINVVKDRTEAADVLNNHDDSDWDDETNN